MFCYCPLNGKEHCPGNPRFIESKGKVIKNCMDCNFPHKPENYETVVNFLKKDMYTFDKRVLERNKK
ncbi:hypothetical protein P261_02848 [Lachnospiraceae bacterium TWA4]|nr:hypothetical protein P261_02848 [Lachnospiraceae bacterium TWA4]